MSMKIITEPPKPQVDPLNRWQLNARRPVELDRPGPVVTTLPTAGGSDPIRLRVVTRREMLHSCSTNGCGHDAAFRMTIGDDQYALVCVRHAWSYGWFDEAAE